MPSVDHYLLPIIAFVIRVSLLLVANEIRKPRGEKRSRVA